MIAIHGKENADSSVIGRMEHKKAVQVARNRRRDSSSRQGPEVWRNNSMESFTSTPVYRNGRLYTTIKRGELVCIDAQTGEEIRCSSWLRSVHASPLWADGKPFVPMFDGKISVVVDEGDSGRILGKTTLDGACSPPRPPPTVESSSKPKKGFIALVPICRRRLSWPSLRRA